MTQTRNTKKALLASVLSVVICLTMLIGSTFAWFTDSATTGVNKITSGNLDVELYYSADKMVSWKNAENVENVFTADKWEPGYTQVGYFKVKNAGSLALDYKVATNVVKETAGVNQKGNEFKLSDHLQFGIVETATAFADRDAARNAITQPYKFSNIGTGETRLTKGAEQTFAVVVWMPEETNNDANHNGTKKPEIQFGINVIASQANVESDSFDENYDGNSDWPNAPALDAIEAKVGTAEELKDIIETAFKNYGDEEITVTLTQDIDVDGQWTTFEIPNTSANIVIDGAGYTISNLNKPLVTAKWGGWGDLTFKNITLSNAKIENFDAKDVGGSISASGAFMAYVDAGETVIFDGCKVIDSVISGDAEYHGALIGYSSTSNIQFKNCSVEKTTVAGYKSAAAIIGHIGDGAAVIDNCAVTNCKISGTRDNNTDIGVIFGRSSGNKTVTMTKITESANTLTKAFGTATESTIPSQLYGSLNGYTATLDGESLS